jgi:hypothetical protein
MSGYLTKIRKLVVVCIILALIFTSITVFYYGTKGEKTTLQLYFKQLEADNTGVMDAEKPTGSEDSIINLDEVEGVMWLYENEEPLRIDGKVTVTLYFKSNILATRTVIVSLYDYTTEKQLGSKSQKVLSTLLGSSATFTFNVKDYELSKKNGLAVVVSANKTGLLGRIGFLKLNLLYNSNKHPSNVKMSGVEVLEEPSPFTILVKENGQVIESDILKPGGIGEYRVEVINSGEENDNIILSCKFTKPGWSSFLYNNLLYVPANDYNFTNLTITAPPDIETNTTLIITATGTLGSASISVNFSSSKALYEYDVELTKPSDGKAKSGENITYIFTIKNVGDDVDSYNLSVSSQHGWNVWIEKKTLELAPNKEEDVKVRLTIPSNASVGVVDTLTLYLISTHGVEKSVKVKTEVISPDITEIFFVFMKSISDSIGLTSIVGDFGPYVFLLILILIILIIIFIVLYLIRKKYVEIICIDRIKEIKPGGKAEYNLTVLNPYKVKLLYNLSATASQHPNWNVSISEKEIILDPNESRDVKITVETKEADNIGDWSEIKVKAVPSQKQSKAKEISLMTILREGKPELVIKDVKHRPKTFKSGDIVTTSFIVENNGDAPAINVSTTLYINGKEKNKVENITIPDGGYASIKLPWIASKGKNNLHIAVRQK